MSAHRLRLWSATAWRWGVGGASRVRAAHGYDHNSFWDWLSRQLVDGKPTWVWAHNASRHLAALKIWQLFDCGELSFSAPPGPARKGGPPPQKRRERRGALVSGDPPTVIVCYDRRGRKIVFLDTMNWLDQPLESFARDAGLDVPDRPGECADDDVWQRYVIWRCQTTADVVHSVLSWCERSDVGNLRWTVAAQSLQAYRHWPMRESIVIHDDLDVKARERESYYAGRCCLEFQGVVTDGSLAGLERLAGLPQGLPYRCDGPVYRLDVNACYPSVMLGRRYPTRYVRTEHDMQPDDLRQWLVGGCACACVLLQDEIDAWPCKRDGHLWHVAGRVRTVLCGPELIRALDGGVVRSVPWAQLYVGGQPFDEFAHRCFAGRALAREESDLVGLALWKSLSVSLHGKLGQRRHRWTMREGETAPVPWGPYSEVDADTGAVRTCRAVAWNVQEMTGKGESDHSSPILSAYVCAYARELLRTYRQIAGEGNVLYEDADCLHVAEAGFHRLYDAGNVQNATPGQLKVAQMAHVAVYHGPRDYRLDDVVVCCGLSPDAVPDATGLWAETHFKGLDAQLTDGMPFAPVSMDLHLTRPNNVIRGAVLPSGTVVPCRVTDW